MLPSMNVAVLQFDVAWENKQANFSRVRELLTKAQLPPGTLAALPEMFATGFSMNVQQTAEATGGPTEMFLRDLAQELKICLIAGVAMLGNDGQARNQALACSARGDLLAAYAKMRLFSPGNENRHYAAGQTPVIFEWQECRVAPFICYDLRFPELFRAAAAARRPEVMVVIANWPEKRIWHWKCLLRARAIENQAFVIAANRIGADPFYNYGGCSMIIDPHGEVLADAGASESCVQAELDLASLQKYREGLPFLDDLKP
jgi:omega-amidase